MTSAPDPTAELSVVVAVIAGGRDSMRSCLTALEASASGNDVECLVPYDARLDGVDELAARFPWVEFIDARAEVTARQLSRFSREHHDVLRTVGLRRARGRLVALLEDHGPPSAGWCAAVRAAHAGPEAAIGGAVENGVDRLLNWAVYYCDFGRYQNPVPPGAAEFLSDTNVAYKRAALDSVKDQWMDAYCETSVHWELRRRGHALRLDPAMVTYQTRTGLRWLPALIERYVWGRSFAGSRVAGGSAVRRVRYALLSLALPVVLSARVARGGGARRRHGARLALAMPLVVLLETIWSIGEFVGYVTGSTGGTRRGGGVPA